MGKVLTCRGNLCLEVSGGGWRGNGTAHVPPLTRVRFICETTPVGWLQIWASTEIIQFYTPEVGSYEFVRTCCECHHDRCYVSKSLLLFLPFGAGRCGRSTSTRPGPGGDRGGFGGARRSGSGAGAIASAGLPVDDATVEARGRQWWLWRRKVHVLGVYRHSVGRAFLARAERLSCSGHGEVGGRFGVVICRAPGVAHFLARRGARSNLRLLVAGSELLCGLRRGVVGGCRGPARGRA